MSPRAPCKLTQKLNKEGQKCPGWEYIVHALCSRYYYPISYSYYVADTSQLILIGRSAASVRPPVLDEKSIIGIRNWILSTCFLNTYTHYYMDHPLPVAMARQQFGVSAVYVLDVVIEIDRERKEGHDFP